MERERLPVSLRASKVETQGFSENRFGIGVARNRAGVIMSNAVRKTLLLCGLVSSLLYGAMNVFIPMLWDGYSSFSQTISELSAIDAPTRPVWFPLGILYTVLVAAFGVGVWQSASRNRPLRVLGG